MIYPPSVKHFFLRILCIGIFLMMKDVVASENQATYIVMKEASLGWVNINMPSDGMYVYGHDVQNRPFLQAFLIDKPTRQHFDFFSSQEEEALWNLYEEQVTDKKSTQIKTRKSLMRSKHKTIKIDWPKVIVEDKKICVPKTDYADSVEWKEHLTCWEGES